MITQLHIVYVSLYHIAKGYAMCNSKKLFHLISQPTKKPSPMIPSKITGSGFSISYFLSHALLSFSTHHYLFPRFTVFSHSPLSTPFPTFTNTPIPSAYSLFCATFSARRIAAILPFTDIVSPPSATSHCFTKIYSRPVTIQPYHMQ